MKQRSSKKSIPKEARYPSSLSAAEAERDLQDIQNLIDAAASKKTHERAARISSRNRKDQKPKNQKTPPAVKNHDTCDACGEVGQFICCDACPNAFHLTCVEPPILNVESLDDTWYCSQCAHKRAKGKKTRNTITTTIAATGGTLFKGLIDNFDGKNPKAYRLPKEIYNHFEGISSDKYGQYVDTSVIKRVKYKNGEPILPDYHPFKDDNGNFIVCYKCRKTARLQAIINCDYCPLYWHLDCLDPPRTIPPNPARKWMCPLHIEHTIKLPRKRKGTAKDSADIVPYAPACTYHNYITHIIDDQPKKKQKTDSTNVQKPLNEEIITCKNGTVYRLPETPFQLAFPTKKILQSQNHNIQAPSSADATRRTSIPSTLASTSSKSEVNTPPTIHTSPVSSHKPIRQTKANDSKEEVESWLQSMALFKAGRR